MSTGVQHLNYWKLCWIFSVIISGGVSLLTSVFFNDPIYGLIGSFGVVVGYGLGYLIDPDLDLFGISNAEGRAVKSFGCFGVAWTAYWLFYAYAMRFVGLGRKGHRNFFSHTPGISTIIRLAYVLWIPLWVYWYYFFFTDKMILFLITIWIGNSFSDLIHWLGDIL